MHLSESIRRGVQHRAPFHDHVEQIIASDSGLTVRCDVSSAERLGCAMTQLELVEVAPDALTIEELDARAEKICSKVTYLLEPLRKIELDAQTKAVLLRSKQPKQIGPKVCYYEILADAKRRTSLKRYCFDPELRKRFAVEFLLTSDQLELLVDDLIVVANGIRN
ncbi:MAG: hypothetical protein U1D30_00840 [Planctomycetota bacterium]